MRRSAVLWVVQPLGIVTEVVAAAVVDVRYSFLDNTISDLGAVSCTSVPYPSRPVPVCSPAHALVNGGFVVLGLALVLGAVLLRRTWPPSRLLTASCVLWVVSGLSSVASGLAPLDVDLTLHALVSTPGIAAQPVALGLHALALAREDRRWLPVVALAAVELAVGVFFLLRLDVAWGGLLERAAIWPAVLLLPVLALRPPRRLRDA